MDYDYIDKLSEKEKKLLNKFSEEYYRAYFNKDKKSVNKKASRKAIYDANNARNRCVYTNSRSKKQLDFGNLDLIYEAMEKTNNLTNPEDAIIDMIDKSREEPEEDY